MMQKVNSSGVDRALGDRPPQEHVTRAAVAMLAPEPTLPVDVRFDDCGNRIYDGNGL